MEKDLEIEGYQEVLRDMQHEELVKAVKSVTNAISELPKEDPLLKKLVTENTDAINNFVKTAKEFTKSDDDKIVKAIEVLAGVMKGIGERITELEKKDKPLPTRLKAERGITGNIDYVVIEYSK